MQHDSAPVIEVQDLVVNYRNGSKSHPAVKGITFKVNPGECVGFIGANGAGKSTTMKSLLGFVFPASGSVKVFGSEAGTVQSRRRLGYLPEVALYYPFMKASELLELYGGLQGLSRKVMKSRIPELLEEVGLGGKGNQLLKNFSKGMQQRLGIAQAIIAKPELLIFDELSSGLDPVGRHDLRDVLLRLKRDGATIFFSSHELSEVESLCDRVIIIDQGKIVTQAPVADLMKPLNQYKIVFKSPGELASAIADLHPVKGSTGQWELLIKGQDEYAQVVSQLSQQGCEIISADSQAVSLEDYFINLIRPSSGANA